MRESEKLKMPYIPQWQRNLFLISLGVFVANIAFSTISPFLPMFVIELGVKQNATLWSGLIFSINSLVYSIASPVWGAISDRYSKKAMIFRSGFGMGITYMAMAFVKNHWQLFILRGINGLVSGYTPAATTLVAASSRPENLVYSLGIIQAAVAIGNITGPLFGGIAAKFLGMRGTIIFTGFLLWLAAILPLAVKVDEDVKTKVQKKSLLKDLAESMQNRELFRLYMIWLFIQAALIAISPTLPLYIAKMVDKDPELYTGIIFSIVGVSTALGAPMVARMHKLSTSMVFRISLAIAAGLTALQGLAASILSLGILRFFFGFFNSAITVAGNALIAQNTDKDHTGSSFGLLNGIMSLGSVVGPIVGGYLGDKIGLSYAFIGSGVILLIAFAISMFTHEPASDNELV